MKWLSDLWARLFPGRDSTKPKGRAPRARFNIYWNAPSATTIGVIVAFLLFAGIAIWIIMAVVRFFGAFYSNLNP